MRADVTLEKFEKILSAQILTGSSPSLLGFFNDAQPISAFPIKL
jgi:hypothetical protein